MRRARVRTARAYNRALRSTVARLRGCLFGLSRAERRVVELRAALGRPAVRSRERVARLLRRSVRRVRRLEHAGLRHLRALAQRGACTPTTVNGTDAASSADAATTGGTTPPGFAPRIPQPHVLAERSHGGVNAPRLPSPATESADDTRSWLVNAAVVVMLLLAASPIVLRELRRAQERADPAQRG